MQESPGWKPDWIFHRKSFSLKKTYIICLKKVFERSYNKDRQQRKTPVVFNALVFNAVFTLPLFFGFLLCFLKNCPSQKSLSTMKVVIT